jgi:hypothetical protein
MREGAAVPAGQQRHWRLRRGRQHLDLRTQIAEQQVS